LKLEIKRTNTRVAAHERHCPAGKPRSASLSDPPFDSFYFIIETRSLPAFSRCCPRSFAFYVAVPIRSILTS
jgi:hypothetical protein